MVASKLDPTIEYPEIKKLSEVDEGFDASLYEVELYPKMLCTIVIGNINSIHKDKGVYHMSVYLVVDDSMGDKIGVYECLASNYTNLLDDENDLDIDKLDDPIPLLFSFVTPDYLRRTLKLKKPVSPVDDDPLPSVDDENKEEDKGEESDEYVGDRLNLKDIVQEDDSDIIKSIEVKMMEESIEERKNYKKKGNHNWLQKFLKNKKFGIQDVESQGDCFFAVIREAFKGIGKNITVQQLRNEVSDRATKEVFDSFKQQYDMFYTSISESNLKMKKIYDKIKELKTANATEKNPKIKKQIVEISKPLIEEFKRTKRERENAKKLIEDYNFMKKVKNLQDFKDIIKTCAFWAEVWSINLIEMFLNIKVIIMSSDNYRSKDTDNVLLCSSFVDDSIQIFRPKYYLLMVHTGNHYKLITYDGKRIFTFETIPWDIKQMIVDKCMEKQGGVYIKIPKFIKLKSERSEQMGINEEEEGESKMSDVTYDENTVFQFYSKSADRAPGKGSGEKIPASDVGLYKELDGIPDWRKVLSNFYIAPFELDGHRWNSVEHFYHASKFKRGNPEFYLTFTLNEGGEEISKDPALAKGAGGKTGKFKGKRIRPKEVVMDEDFFTSKRNEVEMERAQKAKYEQNPLAKRVLLYTGNAKLQHFVRASPPIVFYDTMRVRRNLRK
jgi:predicted NAD-dependent protein-ADP-ribosyltransferase YbiA (DUF1768 family)|uniref:OTU domain-containing protein n=1 Tax=viral metagenome TaxID=1070528 RepID=A0A6C0BY75_9ZZZZ